MSEGTAAAPQPAPGLTSIARQNSGAPDLKWVRKHIAVTDIAHALGLEVVGRMVRCWRPDAHQHGDRSPSVGIDVRRNRLRCFCCDERQLSNIDVVKSVTGRSLREAVLWITERFDVPNLPKNAHLDRDKAARWRAAYRIGVQTGPLSWLIRTGIFALLKPAERAVLCTLIEFADEHQEAVISYRGLARYSGVRSDPSIRSAIKSLKKLHALKVNSGPHRTLRDVSAYTLTLNSIELADFAEKNRATMQEEISLEKELRAERRRQMRQQARAQFHTVLTTDIPLSKGGTLTGINLSVVSKEAGNITLCKVKREIGPRPKSAQTEAEKKKSGSYVEFEL